MWIEEFSFSIGKKCFPYSIINTFTTKKSTYFLSFLDFDAYFLITGNSIYFILFYFISSSLSYIRRNSIVAYEIFMKKKTEKTSFIVDLKSKSKNSEMRMHVNMCFCIFLVSMISTITAISKWIIPNSEKAYVTKIFQSRGSYFQFNGIWPGWKQILFWWTQICVNTRRCCHFQAALNLE